MARKPFAFFISGGKEVFPTNVAGKLVDSDLATIKELALDFADRYKK